MTALKYFRVIAPEYAAVSDEAVSVWLLIAENSIAQVFDDTDERAAMAQALYAAHSLTLANRGGAISGAVTSEKEGDLQRSYAANATAIGIASTTYGQQYLALVQPHLGGAITVRSF